MSENQLSTARAPQSVKDYLAIPAYRDRFAEVLKARAPQFMAAIVQVSQLPGLRDAEPRSVIAAAMTAATLDLPVNPTLGFAFIVAYGDGNGNKVAQFQVGFKGLIQLALRSGQYRRLNAGPVHGSAFKGYDMVGEPILDWTNYDPDGDVNGYFCAFETLNGFQKIVYWTKAQCESHAKRFSKAYAKGYSTPWKTDFDSMATKTVIKAALTKWGIMSVEMQKAAVHDQSAQADLDADVSYVDAGDDRTVSEAPAEAPPRPAPKPRSPKGIAAVKENVTEVETAPAKQPAQELPQPSKPAAPVDAPAEAPPVKAPEQPKGPRAMLNDNESITVEVIVKSIEVIDITVAGAPVKSVKASVSGGFVGEVRHRGGANENGPVPPWALNAPLLLKLEGHKSAAPEGHPNHGKVLAWVIEATEVVQEF